MLRWWLFRIRMWTDVQKSRLRMGLFMHRRAARASGIAAAIAALVSLAFFAWIAWPRPPVCSGLVRAQACELMEAGRYTDALADIEEHRKREPEKSIWAGLTDLMLKEMTVRLRLHYLAGGKMPIKKVQAGKLALSTSDKYYYVVDPSESCYLYLFQISSAGELRQLFPNKALSGARNPIPAGRQQIPASPGRLELKPPAGQERVIFVAARWALPELESLAKQVSQTKDTNMRQEVFRRFLARVANEKQHTGQLGGLVFAEASFTNSGL